MLLCSIRKENIDIQPVIAEKNTAITHYCNKKQDDNFSPHKQSRQRQKWLKISGIREENGWTDSVQ